MHKHHYSTKFFCNMKIKNNKANYDPDAAKINNYILYINHKNAHILYILYIV